MTININDSNFTNELNKKRENTSKKIYFTCTYSLYQSKGCNEYTSK